MARYVKGYVFLFFARKYKKQLLDVGLGLLKTASRKLVHKKDEFLGKKIADAVTNWYNRKVIEAKPAKEIIIVPEKRKEMSSN